MGTSFTPDGNVLGEAVSALQKSIRRAEVDNSIYFGLQIFQRFPWYLLKRLSVIAAEDIGLANLLLVERVLATTTTLTKMIEFHRKTATRPFPHDLIVAQVLYDMAMSPKSREADHMIHEVLRERRVGMMPIPTEREYEPLVAGLVGHIVQQQEKEALNYLLTLIDGYATWIWPELTALGAALIADGTVTATLTHLGAAALHFFEDRKYYEGNFPAFAILLLCRSDLSKRTEDLYRVASQSPKREIPDYAHDVHTMKGRRMGRDYMHFVEVGSLVVNEAYPSRYRFYDPVHGTASMAADGKTKMPEPYKVANNLESARAMPSVKPQATRPEPKKVEEKPAVPDQPSLF